MLKVMTLNINYYGTRHGPWAIRRELIRDAIASAQPHIVALQAVRKDPSVERGVDQATRLANLLPKYKYVFFQPAARTPDGGAEGSAILSRLAPADTSYLPLTLIPNQEDTNHRVLLMATLDLQLVKFHLFDAHWSWVDAQAQANLQETLPYIDSFKGPALLVGDLNQPPESAVMNRLAGADWTDVWDALCPGDNGWTFEVGNLTRRIDYAWANYTCAPKVKDIQIIANRHDPRGADASDHLGLLVTLDYKL